MFFSQLHELYVLALFQSCLTAFAAVSDEVHYFAKQVSLSTFVPMLYSFATARVIPFVLRSKLLSELPITFPYYTFLSLFSPRFSFYIIRGKAIPKFIRFQRSYVGIQHLLLIAGRKKSQWVTVTFAKIFPFTFIGIKKVEKSGRSWLTLGC